MPSSRLSKYIETNCKPLAFTSYSGQSDNEIVQLIKHNMRNVFVEKSYNICDGETIPRHFSKNQKWAYLLINSL